MKKTVLLLLTMLCSCNFLLCYSHQIDVEEENCLNNAVSTAEMSECTIKAKEAWKKEIDKNYKLLDKVLNKTAKTSLKTSQKEWEKYKDFQTELYRLSIIREGTMYQNVVVGLQMDLYKQRAIDLKDLYEIIQER